MALELALARPCGLRIASTCGPVAVRKDDDANANAADDDISHIITKSNLVM